MEETIEFYGFRGNIIFPDQVTLFSMGFENKSKDKNQVFKNFFEDLKENGRVDSEYQKRRYYLIFINQYDSIIHCQLARERISDKYEMTKEKIVGTKDKDYPFINVFIELETQKFLIEYKSTIFENHATCGDVIQNIMNKYLKKIDATININPIAEEQEFWKFFEEDMMLIFFLTIIIITVDFLKVIDIPLAKNVLNLDLGIIKIISLKEYIFNFIISRSACLSFYSLYDLIQATFKILRKSFEK